MDTARQSRNESSADFQVCCIAGFQTGCAFAVRLPCRLGSQRYSRLENLRYRFAQAAETLMAGSTDEHGFRRCCSMRFSESVFIRVHPWFHSALLPDYRWSSGLTLSPTGPV